MVSGPELLAADLAKEAWGNLPANLDFLERAGLLADRNRILEIGCGKGKLLSHLASTGHEVFGLDHDPEIIVHDPSLRACCGEATPNIMFNFPFEMFRNIRRLGWRHTFAFLEPPWHCNLHSYWGVKRDLRAASDRRCSSYSIRTECRCRFAPTSSSSRKLAILDEWRPFVARVARTVLAMTGSAGRAR